MPLRAAQEASRGCHFVSTINDARLLFSVSYRDLCSLPCLDLKNGDRAGFRGGFSLRAGRIHLQFPTAG